MDGEPGEDRIFTIPNAVIVLDGASQATPSEHDGRWLADTLGRELRDRLATDPAEGLRGALAQAIAAVAQRHGLAPGGAPSTTVAIVRWAAEAIDALVLGDTTVLVEDAMANLPNSVTIAFITSAKPNASVFMQRPTRTRLGEHSSRRSSPLVTVTVVTGSLKPTRQQLTTQSPHGGRQISFGPS